MTQKTALLLENAPSETITLPEPPLRQTAYMRKLANMTVVELRAHRKKMKQRRRNDRARREARLATLASSIDEQEVNVHRPKKAVKTSLANSRGRGRPRGSGRGAGRKSSQAVAKRRQCLRADHTPPSPPPVPFPPTSPPTPPSALPPTPPPSSDGEPHLPATSQVPKKRGRGRPPRRRYFNGRPPTRPAAASAQGHEEAV